MFTGFLRNFFIKVATTDATWFDIMPQTHFPHYRPTCCLLVQLMNVAFQEKVMRFHGMQLQVSVPSEFHTFFHYYYYRESPVQFNTLRPRQMHFLEYKISTNISLYFVPKGQINNIPALVQKMAWHRPGDGGRALKWKDLQGDSPGIHQRRRRQASPSPANTRAVTMMTFLFLYGPSVFLVSSDLCLSYDSSDTPWYPCEDFTIGARDRAEINLDC